LHEEGKKKEMVNVSGGTDVCGFSPPERMRFRCSCGVSATSAALSKMPTPDVDDDMECADERVDPWLFVLLESLA